MNTTSLDSPLVLSPRKAWSPQIKAGHLYRGGNGTWYVRLAIPPHVREHYPALPKELRRSTKTPVKSLALAKAQKLCLDFAVRYSQGAEMPQPDLQPSLPCISFILIVENGVVRPQYSPAASTETLLVMSRCMQHVLMQVCGRGVRAANDAPKPLDPSALAAASPSDFVVVEQPQAEPSGELVPLANPTAQQKVLWLSDAIDDWQMNGGTKFSAISWKNSYEPVFRVFRELIGDVRRDRQLPDGTTAFNMLDIEMHRIERSHITALHAALKQLPPNQGKSTKIQEAWQRIHEGRKNKAKAPSLNSVSTKLSCIAPFIRHAKRKEWVSDKVLDEMVLAVEAAEANLVKSKTQGNKVSGYVALSSEEVRKFFEQPAFLDGAMDAAWRYWIPLICIYQGTRVSEASGLYTDDLVYRDGTPCLSFIPDDTPEDEPEEGEDTVQAKPQKEVVAKSGEEYRRLKNEASRRVVPIHPRLIELGFIEFVQRIADYASRPTHLFYGLRWEEKSMFGRKPSRYMRGLLSVAKIAVPRKKVPHSLRSNFNQALNNVGLAPDLLSRMLGHATGAMKDQKYNETDEGPALPFQQVLSYLARVDFGFKMPTWSEVKALEVAARAKGKLPRPVSGS